MNQERRGTAYRGKSQEGISCRRRGPPTAGLPRGFCGWLLQAERMEEGNNKVLSRKKNDVGVWTEKWLRARVQPYKCSFYLERKEKGRVYIAPRRWLDALSAHATR